MAAQRLERPQEGGQSEVGPSNPFTMFPPDSAAMLQAGSAWFDGLTSVNQEILTFCQTELRRGIEVSQALCRCSSFDEVIGAGRSTLDCYDQEAGKIFDLFAETGRKTFSRIRSAGADGGRAGPLH